MGRGLPGAGYGWSGAGRVCVGAPGVVRGVFGAGSGFRVGWRAAAGVHNCFLGIFSSAGGIFGFGGLGAGQ